jgi:iron complex transport system substrate-binding protein
VNRRASFSTGAASAARVWVVAAGLWAMLAGGAGGAWAQAPVSVSAVALTAVTVTDDRGVTLRLAAPPQRIVSLVPSLSETVCELGACDRLVATDRYSNWPERVRALPKLGGLEDTQVERLVALKPDLVLLARSSRALDRLQALGLPVLALEPQDWAGTLRVVAVLADALGTPAAGRKLTLRMNERISAAAARVPPGWRGRAVYVEVASTPYAAGDASFIGELLRRLGLGNAVPAALGPFPQLNPEFVLRAQPALIVASQGALRDMAARPGWGHLKALQTQRTCGLAAAPWDALVRPGPRLAEAAEALAACLEGLAP